MSTETIYAVARDVTREVELERDLRRASLAADTRLALLSALVEAIGVGVILVDREMLVAQWNKEATRLTGIQADKVLGQRATVLGEAIAPRVEDFPSVQAHLAHAFDVRRLLADGANRWKASHKRCVFSTVTRRQSG